MPKISTQNIVLIVGTISLLLAIYYYSFSSPSNQSFINATEQPAVIEKHAQSLSEEHDIDISKLPPEIRSQAKELANLGNVIEGLKNEALDERIRQAKLTVEEYKERGLLEGAPAKTVPPSMIELEAQLQERQQALNKATSPNNQN